LGIELVNGDLTNYTGDAIVNPWNQQIIPWWLLMPHGVSGQIKRQAGTEVFRELAKYGRLLPGQAVLTKAGRLPCRYIIHVAGIGFFGRSDAKGVTLSTHNALVLAAEHRLTRLAFPLIGAGSGGLSPMDSYRLMLEELLKQEAEFEQILLVIYEPEIYEKLRDSKKL
jgi:O-acetyl-ADP-ribose deacetylase (regulator of RNase III)